EVAGGFTTPVVADLRHVEHRLVIFRRQQVEPVHGAGCCQQQARTEQYYSDQQPQHGASRHWRPDQSISAWTWAMRDCSTAASAQRRVAWPTLRPGLKALP